MNRDIHNNFRKRGGKCIMHKMKEYKHFFTLGLFILFIISTLACKGPESLKTDKGPSAGLMNGSGEREALLKVINETPFLTDEIIDEEGEKITVQALAPRILEHPLLSTVDETLPPTIWWRKRDKVLKKDIDITIEGDTANVKVTTDIAGTLYVDDTRNGKLDPWSKPFYHTIVRHATFNKVHNRWKLSALSPVSINLTDSENQTVKIEEVTVYREDTGDMIWQVTSPETLFSVPDELPILTAGTEIRVEARVTNSKDTSSGEPLTFVYLHRPGGRDLMHDDGLDGDVVAGDGVYTKIYKIGHNVGRYFAVVDAIDGDTLLDKDAPYNSTALGMPYYVANEYSGTMEYLNIEGGCWRLVGHNGEFEPVGGPPELYRDGKTVVIHAIPEPHKASICMTGNLIKVLEVK